MVIALAFAGAAAAQTGTAVVTRADAAASIGLFSADRLNDGCCWASSLFKGVSTGFYWTEHLKIEAALSAPGRTEAYTGFSERLTGNTFRYVSERHAFDPLSMSVAQTYQFGHNAWFHPFVTGGVSVDRERANAKRSRSSSPRLFRTRRAPVFGRPSPSGRSSAPVSRRT
jgi:hypothetical protein